MPARIETAQTRKSNYPEIRTKKILGVHEFVLLRDALGQRLSVVDHEQHALLQTYFAGDGALGVELRPQLLEFLLKRFGLLRRHRAEVLLDLR